MMITAGWMVLMVTGAAARADVGLFVSGSVGYAVANDSDTEFADVAEVDFEFDPAMTYAASLGGCLYSERLRVETELSLSCG